MRPPLSARLSAVILAVLIVALSAWSVKASLRNRELLDQLGEARVEIELRETEVRRLERIVERSVEETERQLITRIQDLQGEIRHLERIAQALRRQVRQLGGEPVNGGQGPPGPRGPPGPQGPDGDDAASPPPRPPPPPPRDCLIRVPLIDLCLVPDNPAGLPPAPGPVDPLSWQRPQGRAAR